MAPSKGPVMSIKQHANGYYYHYFYDGKRTRWVSLKTKDRAEALQKVAGETEAKDRPLSFILQYYLDEKERKVSSVDTLTRITMRLIHHLGHMSPRELKPSVINKYAEKRGVKSGTLRRELGVLIAALNLAAKRDLIESNAIPLIELPEPSKPREQWATLDQLDMLLEKAPRGSRVERFLWLAIETGARRSAILSLKWDAICFTRGLIDFSQGARDTKKRRAVVPISDRLMPVLKEAYSSRTTSYVLDSPGEIRKSYGRVVKEADLEWITPHVIRHSWASNAAMAGVPFVEIARVLGNSVAMVEKVYAKYAPDYLRSAINYRRQAPSDAHKLSRRPVERPCF